MSAPRSARAPSQPLASTLIGFSNLPIEIRNNIYERVLTVPHPLYIFQDLGSRVEIFAPGNTHQWLALLFVNRQIYYEARAVLYGNNHFYFMETTPRLLASFINFVGHVNAGLLSHLSIKFPTLEISDDRPGEFKLCTDSLQSVQLLQQVCNNLETLEALIYNSSDVITDDRNTQSVREALAEINAQFRCIRSLREIIIRVYTKLPLNSIREVMEGLGWVVLVGDA